MILVILISYSYLWRFKNIICINPDYFCMRFGAIALFAALQRIVYSQIKCIDQKMFCIIKPFRVLGKYTPQSKRYFKYRSSNSLNIGCGKYERGKHGQIYYISVCLHKELTILKFNSIKIFHPYRFGSPLAVWGLIRKVFPCHDVILSKAFLPTVLHH